MAYITTNLDLNVWDLDSDTFDRADLVDNWEKIDADYARQRSANQVESSATVPSSGNFDGRLIYLTAAASGFPAKTVIRYNGSSWAAVGPTPEVFAALPTSGNFQGRVVVLTAASGGFAANDVVVNTNGATNWKKIGGVGTGTSLPGSPVAGDLFLLTAAASGFDAWSLVTYTGTAWITTERRGVEVGSTLPVTPYAGQLFVLSSAAGGFAAWDVVRWNGSVWGKINGQSSYVSGTWPTSPADGDIIIVPWGSQVGQFRYNAGSASAYKWEHIGAGPQIVMGSHGSTAVVPKTGEYIITWGTNFSGTATGEFNTCYINNVTTATAVTTEVVNGTPGSQSSGITTSSAMAGAMSKVFTLTSGHTLQVAGRVNAPYAAYPTSLFWFGMFQPIRVQAT